MTAILFSLMIVLQGIPVQQGGTVSGILRDSRGMPVAGVRMAAVARGDPLEKAGPMSGITETDTQGRFTLENIPPGRYVIAAGRLDLQTFYPGTQSLWDAAILTRVSEEQ
jgi:protocatechuate 3,4-dioxygenase beta subunit